ncbi:MAG: hypothetical protein Q9M10_03585, partial [Mariprofundaceae bacterium]|nr:hypothetical protein [Mariprofundaceae bacterium]
MASYKHTGINRTVTAKQLGRQMPFTARLTAVIDQITARLALIGTTTGVVTAYITDNSGTVISQHSSVTLTIGITTDVTFQGLNAHLVHGLQYSLFILAEPIPDRLTPGVHHVSTPTEYNQTLVITEYKLPASPWVLTTSSGAGFPMGGTAGFQASGSGYRSLDVGSVPSSNGTIQIVASESSAYPMVIDAYFTQSSVLFAKAGVLRWSVLPNVKSGDVLPPARYWRFFIRMQSNAANDIAPVLDSIGIYFDGAPTIFTNRAQLIEYVDGSKTILGEPVLENLSSMTSQLTAKPASVFTG